ncbi:putative Zinc finger, PARP-type, endonuclease/exonuclease/phosphatase [Plasmopara halstedii]
MKLRVLTFNLFFDEVARSLRMRAIGRLVEHFRPAIIGFQEVTRDALTMLKKQQWAKFYDCSVDTAPPFQETYFVTLFSALPIKSLETHPFANTGMGRELVIMQVEVVPGKTLFVATAHLESLPQFAELRVNQLKESLNLLRDRVNNAENDESIIIREKRCIDRTSNSDCLGAVFMGDTNLLKADMKLLDQRLAAFADVDVELAKSTRSKCRICGDAIKKESVRVGKMVKSTVSGRKMLEIRVWFHDSCFLNAASTTDDEKELVRRKGNHLRGKDLEQCDEEMDMATLGLPCGWKDLWLSVPGNTEENGYTFDGTRNSLVTSRAFRSRLDRIYFYPAPNDATQMCEFNEIVVVGQQKIADGLWPSDHFGLLSTFTLHEDQNVNAASYCINKKARQVADANSKQCAPTTR